MAKRLGWYRPEQLILKIELAYTDPKIWRKVEVHNGLTLHDLHYVIQCVFDWNNSHLYHFLVPPNGKLTGKALREARRYHVLPPDPFLDGITGQDDGRADEAMLCRVLTAECKQIVYEYDFGDSWTHVIKLVKRTDGGDPYHIPQCLAGENAAPADDTGGIPGFYSILDALRDPNAEMHDEAVNWLGQDFDPAQFDLESANRRLAATFKPVPKRARKPRKKK